MLSVDDNGLLLPSFPKEARGAKYVGLVAGIAVGVPLLLIVVADCISFRHQ